MVLKRKGGFSIGRIIGTFPHHDEFARAKNTLDRLGLTYETVSPDPGFARVGMPALIVEKETQSRLYGEGPDAFICSGWVDYRPASVIVPAEAPSVVGEDVFGHAVIMVLAFLHLMQDTLSSVAVALAALLSHWRFGIYLDPIASLVIVLLILRGSWKLLRDTARILLEGTPPDINLALLQQDIQDTFPVRDLHHVHVWELGSDYRLLTAHVRLKQAPLDEVEALLAHIRKHLAQTWSINHATLEPEINGCASTELVCTAPTTHHHK